MIEEQPSDGQGGSGQSDWYLPTEDENKVPFYRRTDVLVVFAAVAVLALVGGAAAALIRASGGSGEAVPADLAGETGVVALTPMGSATTTDPVPDVEHKKGVVAAAPTTTVPLTTTAPATTTTATTTTTTTKTTTSSKPTTTTTKAPANVALPPNGRFSGVIQGKAGDVWTITGWDGAPTQIRVTPATRLVPKADLVPREQFLPGQTVSVFWVSVGENRLAESVYGLS